MEVKIGVQYAARELVIETSLSADQVEKTVADAVSARDGVLSLVDDKGRRIVVPAGTLAYVEIADTAQRSVGFASS